MHGESGIILEPLKLEEIYIFQNLFFHAVLVIWSINNNIKEKKIFTRNDNSRIIGLN